MKNIEVEKQINVEQGLGNDYSPTHDDTNHTEPRGDFSRSRDITTKHYTNGEKADPASGERQNDPAKNGTDSFNDTDLTVDASAVAPRTLPLQVEGNSKQPEEARFDGTVRCGDGPVNILGQEREDPVDLSDIATAATETNRTEETRQSTFWFEVIDFLQRMMLFKDFIMFARRLANNTNKEFFKIIDVVIENSGEGNERKYQILKRWREATPNAQLKDVIDAMKFYHHNVLCAELLNQLKDENLLDADDDLLGTVTAQSGNDNSLYPGIGLSIQDADIYIEENDLAYGGHLEMEYLKSFKC
ncbi:uncharacterized protein LOC132737108 [Ruditapes philippinarum]|uniref:uncharacterized protein LOC132737108 n=1 Tax=Ruditapes philippinarum TaxID=129788 RepID=UPI00295C04FF|nr:uncharacterized protein LOC132737108 [Ruditapes philippinarum]